MSLVKGSRKSNPFCKSFCFLTENTSSHHSCASPRPWLWSHSQEDTQSTAISNAVSLELLANSKLPQNSRKWALAAGEGFMACLEARRAEQTSVVYNKIFEDYLKLKRKIFLLLMNPETICYQLYLLISLIH